VIDADFITSRKELNTDYNNFIPSVSVQRKFKNLSSLNLGYTQRIQRPGIWQLNPYEDRNDKYIQSGNPDLQPVLNHNFDLSYSITKKGSITSGLSYSFANNTVQYVQSLIADTTRATFMNIGKNKNLGANLNTNYPFTKEFSVNINARISYVWMDGFINSMLFKNEGLQGNASANASYKFDNDWRASVNAGYYSPWITLQGQSNAYYYTSASFSKDFLKKKASFSASVNNPFQKWRSWRNETNTPEFSQVNDYSNFYRQFNFSINYKFGKLKDGIKKNKRGINNDDVSGGKGGGGQ
ncbi:MAG: outer membrane beta-barrel family protein, partial [Sphingobacteriaceae bacterium]